MTNLSLGLFLIPVGAAILAPPLSPQGPATDIAARVERYVKRLAANDEFSGTVLIAKGDRILHKSAHGLASKRFDVPMRIDTKINLGSMNKMFTGIAVCQLAQRGKLKFTDTIGDHLPDYPNAEAAEKVTIHHLLTHTSGLGGIFNDEFDKRWRELRTPRDHLMLFAKEALRFEPGERFSYSNAGPVVLGLIIEKITGKSYYDYVREHVYKPSGMTDSDSYSMDEPVKNLAIGYTKRGPGRTQLANWRNNMFTHRVRGGPAGGGFSTVEDLHRFARAVLENRLLDAAHTKLWMTGKVEAFRGPMKYGYLCGHHAERGVEWHGHNGGHHGISASLAFFPELGYTVAVLSNYDRAAVRVADYARSQILLVHGEAVAAAQNRYSLGVMLAVESGSLLVDDVVDGGAAQAGGLRGGDKVLTLNGTKLGGDPLAQLRLLLGKPDAIRFGVERTGEKVEVVVTPRARGAAAKPAAHAKAGSPIVGKWQMTTTFGDREIAATMTITRAGGALFGVWESLGQKMKVIDLQLTKDKLTFARHMGSDGPKMQFTGKLVDGKRIVGAFDFDGRELTCRGQRHR